MFQFLFVYGVEIICIFMFIVCSGVIKNISQQKGKYIENLLDIMKMQDMEKIQEKRIEIYKIDLYNPVKI